jgi:glycosyltransferase involved in cell wall biosynthesis
MSTENSQPLVSTIAVCYNHARYLEETLDSILAQTYPNIQLIIMDDCSQDNSVEVIREWIARNGVDCTFIAHEENQGLCKTLNEALGICKGEYLQLIACDDIMLPEKTRHQVKRFSKLSEEVAVVYSDADQMNEEGVRQNKLMIKSAWGFEKMPEGRVFDKLLDGNFIPALTVMIRRQAILDVGGYDEDLPFEDYDMWLRVSRRFLFAFDEYTSAVYRKHSDNYHKKLDFPKWEYWLFLKHKNTERGRRKVEEAVLKLYFSGCRSNRELRDFRRRFFRLKSTGVALNLFVKLGIPNRWYSKTARMYQRFFRK